MATKKKPPRPSDDDDRVRAVHELKILDSRREARFDRLTREIADVMEVPVSYVAIIDAERQWLKSKIGDIPGEIDRDQSFCTYTIMEEDSMIVRDAGEDERFADNPFVVGDPHLRFYAGVPIKDSQGNKVGTVCVADTKPRDISEAEVAVLKRLALRVQQEINAKPSVFISYAHEDEQWKDRLEVHCAILKRQGLLSVWDDRRIRAGTDWNQQIREAAERAKAAVLLISADFLASDFILNDEIPLLLERRDAEGLEIFPLLIKPCGWQHVDWLARMNLRPRDGRPISTGTEAEIESDLVEFATELAQTIAEQGRALEASPASPTVSPARTKAKPPAAPPAIKVGSRLGSYEILQALGAGGMGEVFVARDANLKRKVAIKVLKPQMASNPERLNRFQREAETVAALNHPNIVTLFSIEEDRGIRFLTMELVEGKTLDEITPARGLPLDKIYQIAVPLLEALVSAHNRGIVHRDLKANNVMVSKTGQVKVLDFGLAKLLEQEPQPDPAGTTETEEGLAVGTFPYMSPEQLEGKPVDARTDIYSVGVVLYEMVTGRMPFEAKSATGLVASILRDPPPSLAELRSRLPESLNGIIQRCLQKDPDKRYQSALDVRNALVDSKDDELAKSLPPDTIRTFPAPARRKTDAIPAAEAKTSKTPFIAAAVVAVLVLLVAGFWMRRGTGSEVAGQGGQPAAAAPPAGSAAQAPARLDPAPEPPERAAQPVGELPASEPPARPPDPQTSVTEDPRSPDPEPPVQPPERKPRAVAEQQRPPPSPSREEPAAEPVAVPREVEPSGLESSSAGNAAPRVEAGDAVQEKARPPDAPVDPQPPPPRPALPEPPPPEPAPDPREAILRTLDKLARAYEALDADAIVKLWPTAPGDRLATGFALMESQEYELHGCRIRLAGDDRATVSCTEKVSAVAKRGPAPPPAEREVEFKLRRSGDSWLIESRR